MSRELRVYAAMGNRAKPMPHNRYNHQSREVVAVKSKAEALHRFRASGLYMSYNEMNDYGGWTGEKSALLVALGKPGVVFFQHIDAGPGSEWTEAPESTP